MLLRVFDPEQHQVDGVVITDLRVVSPQAGPEIVGDLTAFELRVLVGEFLEPLGLDRLDEAAKPSILVVELKYEPSRTDPARVVQACCRGLSALANAVEVTRAESDKAVRIRVGVLVCVRQQVTNVDQFRPVGCRDDNMAPRMLIQQHLPAPPAGGDHTSPAVTDRDHGRKWAGGLRRRDSEHHQLGAGSTGEVVAVHRGVDTTGG